MRQRTKLMLVATGLLSSAGACAQLAADPPKNCSSCEQWNQPQEPFRIFGNTYYVGTTQLSAILIHTPGGLILLDAALPQSAPLIDESIRTLGFSIGDLRLILTSHAHHDHVGGVAALQRASGATVAASPSSAEALRQGRPTADDPQATAADGGFAPVSAVTVVRDGETLTVGDVRITAHFTPGHTPGSTSWTWRACEGDKCVDVVYADSLSAVSAGEFRFTGDSNRSSIVDTFRRSIRTVQELPCDILLTPHPGFSGMSEKSRRRRAGDKEAFVDPSACRAYASAGDRNLSQRVQREEASQTLSSPSLPLKRGFYVSSETTCGEASNATLGLLHAQGMNASRAECVFESVESLGADRYRIVEECAEIGSSETFETTSVWEIVTPESFRRTDDSGWRSEMRYCEQSTLPEGWREIDLEAAIARD